MEEKMYGPTSFARLLEQPASVSLINYYQSVGIITPRVIDGRRYFTETDLATVNAYRREHGRKPQPTLGGGA